MAEKEMQTVRKMSDVSWVRVYHAYFQAMVVEELPRIARRAFGDDAGFAVVASIVEKGAMRGFGVLLEEATKAGLPLEKIGLEELLRYEVACHRHAVEEMGVPFQVFEEAKKLDENRYALETRKCIYAEQAKENPVTCGVCVGLTTGILKRFGIRAQWVRSPERKRLLCRTPNPPNYVVYRDPSVEFPACRIVIERLDCSEAQQG